MGAAAAATAAATTAAAVAPEEAPPQAQTARALCLRSFVLGRRDCGPKITDDVGKNVELDSAIRMSTMMREAKFKGDDYERRG